MSSPPIQSPDMRSHAPAPVSSRDTSRARGSESQQQPVLPTTIAVMGATGSGKTSFINIASGSSLRIGTNLASCTAEVQLANEFILDGQPVVLIDTPGFDDTTKSDTDILKLIAAFLATAYETDSKLTGVIYIHRISDERFTGIARRNLKMFRDLCGDSTLKNVIIVTNMWGKVSQDVGEARENELSTNFFKQVLDKGAQLARHHETAQSAHDIIRCIIRNRPIVLQIQRELVDDHKDIVDTAAGEAINKELNEQIRRHQAELKDIQEEMKQALEDKDEETRQEMEEAALELQEVMKKMRMDSDGMESKYQEEKKRMEEVMREMQEQLRQERERADAAYKQQIDDLNRRLQEGATTSAAERQTLRQQLDQLRHEWDNRSRGCLVM